MSAPQAPLRAVQALDGHWLSVGNDGAFVDGHDASTVKAIIDRFLKTSRSWSRRRLLLYVHGGLVTKQGALKTLALLKKGAENKAEGRGEVYVLGIVWRTGLLDTLRHVLDEMPWFSTVAPDFDLEDRLKEAVARAFPHAWLEMKENAERFTTTPEGAGNALAAHLARALREKRVELHVVGHSAGSILLAPFLQKLTSRRGPAIDLASFTLWAPACTMDLFHEAYAKPLTRGWLGRATVVTLTPEAELADPCSPNGIRLYDHSLLHLVSRGFERQGGWRGKATPLLGLAGSFDKDDALRRLREKDAVTHVTAPTPRGTEPGSNSKSHAGFNKDPRTRHALYATVHASPRDPARVSLVQPA